MRINKPGCDVSCIAIIHDNDGFLLFSIWQSKDR